MAEWPSVVVVMPVLNEERHLADSVERIVTQDYPGELSIVLAVGPSSDRTDEVAQRLVDSYANVHMVPNPSGRTPSGLNAAIALLPSDVVVRVDGHAMIPPTYVRTGVEVLVRTGADNVGGVMAAEGTTPWEQAVAAAMRSRFGVGGAAFHVGGKEGPADTVYLGCFQRSALVRVGGYDESMVRAQDWEMNLRIRQTGGVVWFTPDMHVTYRPRPTLRSLARQYHDYGRWRREVARRYPHTLSLRYLAAPVTVVLITLGLLLALVGFLVDVTWLQLGLLPAVVYVVGVLVASVWTSLRHGLGLLIRLPVVFPTMHFAWGLGFLRGRVQG